MKILTLLLFLVSCENSSPRFKAGDCFAFEYGSPAVTGSILETSEEGYRVLLKAADGFLLNKTYTETMDDWVSRKYLEDNAFKINCEE